MWLQEWSKDVRLARVEFFLAAISSVHPGDSVLAMCTIAQLLDGTICTITQSVRLPLLWWAQKSARLHNICQDSGVGSDCGRGDLYNVIFIRHPLCLSFNFCHHKGSNPSYTTSQSPSYHRDEDNRRIAFLLAAQSFSYSHLWRQTGHSSPYAQICWTVNLIGLIPKPRGRKAAIHPRLINNN